MVSFGSLVAFEIHFPISCTVLMSTSFHIPADSIVIGTNMCVEVIAVYLVRLSSAALFAAAPARMDVSWRWYYYYYYYYWCFCCCFCCYYDYYFYYDSDYYILLLLTYL